MLNRKAFFDAVRNTAMFGGALNQSQVDAMNAILDEWERIGYRDVGYIAYSLATARHEPGKAMRPIREAYGTSDDDTIRKLDAAWAAGKLPSVSRPYWRKDASGKAWFGRGLVQLTHRENYERIGKRLGIDLVGNPNLAMRLDVAAKILVVGMLEGLFTGKGLPDYITPLARDYREARRIVNALDRADTIAKYARDFERALRAAGAVSGKPAPPQPPPDIEPPAPSPAPGKAIPWAAIVAAILAAAGAAVAYFFGG